MSYRIEIQEGTVVEVFNDEDSHGLPFLRQPTWPDGSSWANQEEAMSWAEMFVESMDANSTHYAPAGPGQERQPKPTPEEIAAWQAEMQAQQNPSA